MVKQEEIEFLETYLKELQKDYQMLRELSWQDLAQTPENIPSATSPDKYETEEDKEEAAMAEAKSAKSKEDAEHVASLADDNDFDGSIFRDLFTPSEWNGYEFDLLKRHLKKKIETIPRIIAKIGNPVGRSMIPKDAKLLNVSQMATLLGWGKSVVRQRNNDGLLPMPIRIGGTIQWRRKEIRNWIDAGCPARQRWELLKQGKVA